MIEKFVSIQNIGRFRNFRASDDISFKKNSVVFSDNGQGKTTLASILRSLQTEDPCLIEERKTLGAIEGPHVQIKLESGVAEYSSRSWSRTCENIEIFDSLFVEENVYSGLSVAHEHKKNLYNFIIGSEGVQRARRITQIDELTRAKSGEISAREMSIRTHLLSQSVLDFTGFLSLKEAPDIDPQIVSAEKQLAALRESDTLAKTPILVETTLPSFDFQGLKEVLAKSIPELSRETERRTREHIESCLGEGGESWLQTGLGYIEEDGKCPFCGQSLQGVDIIRSFRSFFDEAYESLKKEISQCSRQIEEQLSESNIARFERICLVNGRRFDFWQKHISGTFAELPINEISARIRALRKASVAVLVRKQASPLESLSITEEVKSAIRKYAGVPGVLAEHNKQIGEINQLVGKKKETVKAANLDEVEKNLVVLRLVKLRYNAQVNQLCCEYVRFVQEKDLLQEEKKRLKGELDEMTEQMLAEFQQSINEYLKNFGANFTIAQTNRRYVGGRPSPNIA